jgi:hypothetical protein
VQLSSIVSGGRLRRAVTLTLTFSILLTGLALIDRSSRQAAQAEPAGLTWTFSPLPYVSRPAIGPSGAIVNDAACSSAAHNGQLPGPILQSVTNAGLGTWSIPQGGEGGLDPACPDALVFDSTGNVYLEAVPVGPTSLPAYLVSYDAQGARRWATEIPDGAVLPNTWQHLQVSSLVIGADGNLWASEESAGGIWLDVLSGATGERLNRIPVGNLTPAWVTAWSGGIVVSNGGRVLYYAYDGSLQREYAVSPFGGQAVAAGADGAIYTASYNLNPSNLHCQDPDYRTVISRVTFEGVEWSTDGPLACINLHLASLPDGGAALLEQPPFGEAPKVRVYGPGGIRWEAVVNAPMGDPQGSWVDLATDTQNRVVVSSVFARTCQNGSASCRGSAINIYDGATGATAAPTSIVMDETDNTALYVAIQQGCAILAGAHAQTNSVGVTDYRLWAVNVPGLAEDYARSNLPAYKAGSGPQLTCVGSTPTPTTTTTSTTIAPTPSGLTVLSATVGTPSPTDALLTRSLQITAQPSPGASLTRYQFGWSDDPTATEPTTLLQGCRRPAGDCRVRYHDTTPDSDWVLFVRAFDSTPKGKPSAWWRSPVIHAPQKPIFVAIGDSVTAGHHRDGELTPIVCNDAQYGYPAYAFAAFQQALPVAWRDPDSYFNFARSGYTTYNIRSGTGPGETDTCGNSYNASDPAASPMKDAAAQLNLAAGSWNQVVATGGINDTNWTDLLGGTLIPNAPLYAIGKRDCAKDVKSKWTGYTDKNLLPSISNNVSTIIASLRTADVGVDIQWLGYYNFSGTGPLVGRTPFSDGCWSATNAAIDKLDSAVRKGTAGQRVRFLSTSKVLDGRADRIQPFYLRTDSANGVLGGVLGRPLPDPLSVPGWPHPNSTGAQEVAKLLKF